MAHSTISAAELSTRSLVTDSDVLVVYNGLYEDITPCSTPTQYVCGQSDHSPTPECSTDSIYEPDQEPAFSYGAISSSERANFRVSGRGMKRLRDVYGEYDANNGSQLHYPDDGTLYLDYLFLSYHNIFIL